MADGHTLTETQSAYTKEQSSSAQSGIEPSYERHLTLTTEPQHRPLIIYTVHRTFNTVNLTATFHNRTAQEGTAQYSANTVTPFLHSTSNSPLPESTMASQGHSILAQYTTQYNTLQSTHPPPRTHHYHSTSISPLPESTMASQGRAQQILGQ
jgi:hypothetical protein